MPTDLANIWFWLYPIFGLIAAIYYGIRIYDYFKQKKSINNNHVARRKADGFLKIDQRELSSRPPVILSILLIVCAFIFLVFGIWIIYTWASGKAPFRISYEVIIFFLLFFCFPVYVFIDQFLIQPKYYKLGRSLVAKEARVTILNNADTVFDACYQVLESMKATVNIINKPKMLKVKIRNSVITIKIRRIKGSKVIVYVLSDSKWLTVRFDAGANQRNIDTFLKELRKQ